VNDGNQKEQTSHNRSILEEIHNLRLKPGRFCVSQGTCDMKVARTPLRFGFTALTRWLGKPATYMAH
jgi:hypothetical protein